MAAIDRLACVDMAFCEPGSGIASITYVIIEAPSLINFVFLCVFFFGGGVPNFNLKCLTVVTF